MKKWKIPKNNENYRFLIDAKTYGLEQLKSQIYEQNGDEAFEIYIQNEEKGDKDKSEISDDNSDQLRYIIKSIMYNHIDPVQLKHQVTSIIDKHLAITVDQILIKFLTLNIFKIIKSEIKSNLMNEIGHFLNDQGLELSPKSAHHIKQYLPHILNNLIQVFQIPKNLNYLINKSKDLLETEVNLLSYKMVEIYQKKLNIFTQSDSLIRSKLKINPELPKQKEFKSKFKFFHVFKNFIFCKIFCPIFFYTNDYSKETRTLKQLTTDGTVLNKSIKSLMGIFSAWTLTLILYAYYRYQLKIEASLAVGSLIITFFILLVGLTFENQKFRTTILLIIPFMASKNGKLILITNCFVLVMAYVVPNIAQNFEHLQYAYTCNLNIFKDQLNNIYNNNDYMDKIQSASRDIKKMSTKVRRYFIKMKNVAKKGVGYAKKAKNALEHVSELCSYSYGSPVQDCKKNIDKVADKCYNKTDELIVSSCFLLEYPKEGCGMLAGLQSGCVGTKKVIFS